MATLPRISCVMVTADRHKFCSRAIAAFVNQSYPNKELVVLDNGTKPMDSLLRNVPDNEVCYEYTTVTDETTLGDLRNQSLDMVRGEIVVPQWDDDDWSARDRLDRQYDVLKNKDVDACTLHGTLMHLDDPEFFNRPFLGLLKGGVPPTIMHVRDDNVRFPSLRRTEDAEYKAVWKTRPYHMLPASESHLYLRYFHGDNTWERDHFMRRMRNTPIDLLAYGWWKFVRRNVFGHPRFRLSSEAVQAFQDYLDDSRAAGLFHED